MVVEDNPVNQLYLKTLLVRAGHAVVMANNGAEAIKEFARSLEREDRRFDLILMDLQMPGIDGFEAARRIREIETRSAASARKIPISALSAYSLREETARDELHYFDHYLTKPVSKQQIEEALVKLTVESGDKDRNESSAAQQTPGGATGAESGAPAAGQAGEARVEEYVQTLLGEFGQDRQELRKMLQMALTEIPQKLSELDYCFRSRDRQQGCNAAHAVANVVGVLCAPAEREIALNLEQLFQSGDWQAARTAYLQLQDRVQLLLQSYRLLLKRELAG
ncbi:MAG: response regulator [bacterium]